MAIIKEREGRYTALIRRKDITLSETFGNIQDANLWAAYKEDLIDQIKSFDPPLKECITLQDAIELKIQEFEKKGISGKELNDYKFLFKFFEKFCSKPLNQITFDMLFLHYNEMLKIPIIRGGTGKGDGSGLKKFPSETTIFRKFAYLSTIYSKQIEFGVEIENIPLKIVKMRRKYLKKENEVENEF